MESGFVFVLNQPRWKSISGRYHWPTNMNYKIWHFEWNCDSGLEVGFVTQLLPLISDARSANIIRIMFTAKKDIWWKPKKQSYLDCESDDRS